uniref:Innexin n=1 Tax=Caenorhabditis japonica TaxID=281687 RepID=A0A8R1I9G0_CAEJA
MNMLGSMFSMVKPRLDDLGTDRLNYYYSTLIIMGMSLTITARQYVGSPLQCWVPAQFTKAWEQYAEDYCFVYNTYWVKPNDKVPDTVEERVSQQLIYYQWAPFIMAFEAAFFYLPVICWSMLSTKSGINIIKLVETAQKAEGAESEDRKKQIDIICRHISNNLRKRKSEEETTKMAKIQKIFGMQHGKYLTNVYIVTKFIYMSNSFLQFYSTNKFLGQNDPYWGMRILDDILHGTDWEHSGNFPRIAMCDFQVRVLGNLQRHSIQCVLSLNMFNEKIFLFLYLWFLLVFFVTVFDTVFLIYNMFKTHKKIEFLQQFIENQDEKDQKFAKKFRREQQILLFSEFCLHKFTPDIIILLKMINNHTADIVCTEIVGRMWNEFLERDAEVVLERLVGNNHINDSRTSSLKSVLDQEKLI